MGIDIYLEWDGMTEDEKEAQATGFSVTSGNVGYLREAYHGGPYATKILCREAFENEETCRAEIPAATLRERLTRVTEPAYVKNKGHEMVMRMVTMFQNMGAHVAGGPIEQDTTAPMTVEEAVRERQRTVYSGDNEEQTERIVQSFRDFVALAEQKERETGKPCTVYASH